VNRFSSLKALVGAAAILTLTLAAEVRYDVTGTADDADRPRQADNVAKRQGSHHALRVPIADNATSILSRPLFAPSRRPTTEQPLPVSKSGNEELPRLAGIVINDPIRLAILQPKSPAKPIVIGVGGEIEGQRVKAISAGDVVIAGPNGEQHLRPAPESSIKQAMAATYAPLPGPIQPTRLQAANIPRPRGGVNFGK